MCVLAAAAALPAILSAAGAAGTAATIGAGTAGAAAAGTAAASTAAAAAAAGAAGSAASGLSLGTLASALAADVSIFGTIAGGIQQSQQASAYAKAQQRQAETERMLGAIEDERTRARMRAEMGRMLAGLAGRGVTLDSPSALALGDVAARESVFASQDARSRSGARVDTLTASSRQSRALAGSALLKGGIGAAGSLLTRAPDLWPGLSSVQVAE